MRPLFIRPVGCGSIFPVKPDYDKLVERPLRRKWIKDSGPAWVVLEPARIAPVGACFFTGLVLVIYLLRSVFGYDMDLMRMVLGVVLTFVLSYAATGCFVWFLLVVADREFPRADNSKRKRSGLVEEKVREGEDVVIEEVEGESVIEEVAPPGPESGLEGQ